MTYNKIPSLLLLLLICFSMNACKKDNPDPQDEKEKVLVINNGAQSMRPDGALTYSASFVFEDGTTAPATGVTWSSSESGIATISSAGVVTTAGVGTVTVTATVSEGSLNYTASAPLAIAAPSVFAVVPSAIIYETGGEIQLETVYFGTSSPTYTFASSDDNVATVSNSGLVRFQGVGSCTISVTASVGASSPIQIPVIVVGPPTITLPVSNVKVTPPSTDLFRQQTAQLSAQAYNPDGPVGASFTWRSSDPAIASVDANGLVTANAIGNVYIYATAQGITGQAEIYVSPDTVIEVTPLLASIPAGGNRQFTAKAYNIRNGVTLLPGITQFDWNIPTYGFGIFDFASVNSSGLVSVNQNALVGNLTFVMASLPGNPEVLGVGAISVSLCDCGNGNPDVASINAGASLNLSLFSNPMGQISATAKDAGGATVSNPALRYCSDDMAIATVDELTGEVSAVGPGTATLRVCSGSYAEATTTVTVAF